MKPNLNWINFDYFTPTETGWTLESGDRVWELITANVPPEPYEQTYLHLVWHEGAWMRSYDEGEHETPIWGSLNDIRAWLKSDEAKALPGGPELWLPVTVGDRWRKSEGKPLRRVASKKTFAAIEVALEKETK